MSEEFSYGRTVKPYPPYNVSTDLEDTTPEHIAGIAAVAAVNDKVEEIQEDAASLIGPATKSKAGLVIPGTGLSVSPNGTTSITESDSVFVDSDGEVKVNASGIEDGILPIARGGTGGELLTKRVPNLELLQSLSQFKNMCLVCP